MFQGGRESSEHKLGAVQRIAAADEVHIACVSTLLGTNWQWTCAILLSEIGIALFTICRILTQNLKMQEICAQWASHNLTGIHVATYGNSDSISVIINLRVEPYFARSLQWMWHAHAYKGELKRESNWVESPRITMTTKVSTGTGAAESHVHCDLQLLGYSPPRAFPLGTTGVAVYYRYVFKHYLHSAFHCSSHISCSQDLLSYMITLTVTLPVWLICSEDGVWKFWNIH